MKFKKFACTALSDECLKNATISDAVLDENVAEKLGFILLDTFEKYIEKAQGKETAKYIIKISKTKGSLE